MEGAEVGYELSWKNVGCWEKVSAKKRRRVLSQDTEQMEGAPLPNLGTLSTRLAKDAHLPQATGSRNPQCAPLMGVQAGKEGSFSRPGRRGRPVPGGALEMGSSFCSHQSKGPGARITGEAESKGKRR